MDVNTLKTDLEAVQSGVHFVQRFHDGPVLQEIDKALTWVLANPVVLQTVADLVSSGNFLSVLEAVLALFGKKGAATPQALQALANQP